MITYQVDMDDLLKIESVLRMTKDKSKLVLRGALNETAKDVRIMLAEEAAKTYVMKSNKLIKFTERFYRALLWNAKRKI